MKNVLISGLGGSLFPYLHHQLKGKYNLTYVDSNANVGILYPDFDYKIAPLVKDPSYSPFIKKLISESKINIYLPLIDEEIIPAHKLSSELGSDLLLFSPDRNFCELCLNKLELMKKLDKLGLSHIKTWTANESDIDWSTPIFVKPIDGRGSRGIRTINSPAELDAHLLLEKIEPRRLLVQKKVIGDEYTIGLMTNKNDDILSIVTKKVLTKKGITSHAVIVHDKAIFDLCHELNMKLKPKGAINIQLFKTPSGELKIFEINPRFSTTSIMSFESGIDEFSLFLDYYDRPYKEKVQQGKEGLGLIRRWENVFYE